MRRPSTCIGHVMGRGKRWSGVLTRRLKVKRCNGRPNETMQNSMVSCTGNNWLLTDRSLSCAHDKQSNIAWTI